MPCPFYLCAFISIVETCLHCMYMELLKYEDVQHENMTQRQDLLSLQSSYMQNCGVSSKLLTVHCMQWCSLKFWEHFRLLFCCINMTDDVYKQKHRCFPSLWCLINKDNAREQGLGAELNSSETPIYFSGSCRTFKWIRFLIPQKSFNKKKRKKPQQEVIVAAVLWFGPALLPLDKDGLPH